MTPLRQKMTEDLQLRNFAASTQRHYLAAVARYARFYGRSPDRLDTHHARGFLLYLHRLGRAPATRIVYWAALRFFYTHTLGRPDVMATIPRPRPRPTPPRIPLTREQARPLLSAAQEDPFTHALLATLLASGLRISEATHLRIEDRPGPEDSTSGLLQVRRGKGHKPRTLGLPTELLDCLRSYWDAERPGYTWLFPAQRLGAPGRVHPTRRWADRPVGNQTLRKRLHAITRRAGLTRRVTPHDLRATYATWLAEAGVDLHVIQVLLGHSSPNTTARYTYVRPDRLRAVPSTLAML